MISAAAVTAVFFVPGLANCASWISIPLERRDLNTKDACVCGRGGSGCHVSSFPFHAFWTLFSGRFLYIRAGGIHWHCPAKRAQKRGKK